VDFESGFGRDTAGLARDPGDQLLLIVFQYAGRFAQDGAALFVRRCRPAGLRGAGFSRGLAHIGGGGIADARKRGSCRRLKDVERSAALRHSAPNTRPCQVPSTMNFGAGTFIFDSSPYDPLFCSG
jgi:hypothetical protein